MINNPVKLDLTSGAVLELYRSPQGREFAQIIARKRRSRWYEWTEITPRLTTIEDGVSQNDYTMGVLAYNIHKASKFKYFKTSELSRLAWKISRRGFKETAQKLSWILQEQLNGYPIIPATPDQGFLFLSGSQGAPTILSGELAHENRWCFKLLRGFSMASQDALIDDISLASIHDFKLRKLLSASRFATIGTETAKRRALHHSQERPLREWDPQNGFRHHYSVNRNLKKERLTYSLVLKVHASNAVSGAGVKGVYNNALVKAADELADSFSGAYKVEGIEEYFELATALMKFSKEVRKARYSSLRDSQVYLNVTKDFDFYRL
mgnify:CR=1 FL=1